MLIITDRTELDEQIEKVFLGVNEGIYRTRSGGDLIAKLNASKKWLLWVIRINLQHNNGRTDLLPSVGS